MALEQKTDYCLHSKIDAYTEIVTFFWRRVNSLGYAHLGVSRATCGILRDVVLTLGSTWRVHGGVSCDQDGEGIFGTSADNVLLSFFASESPWTEDISTSTKQQLHQQSQSSASACAYNNLIRCISNSLCRKSVCSFVSIPTPLPSELCKKHPYQATRHFCVYMHGETSQK